MGSEITRATSYRALLVPDHRLTADAVSLTLSDVTQTLTQAGPRVGTPEPQQNTYATMTAHGTQSARGALRVRALEAGGAGPKGGTFGWKDSTDTSWLGWDPPGTLTGFETIDYSTTANAWLQAHAIGLPNGGVIAVVESVGNDVICWRRSGSTGAWAQSTVASPDGSNLYCPCVVRLPSGRTLCFYIGSTTTTVQVQAAYSDDDGATWLPYATNCLYDPITVAAPGRTVVRLRAAHLGGQIMMIAEIRDTSLSWYNVLSQFASRDLGAHFSTLNTWTGASLTTHGAYPELIATETEFILTYLAEVATGTYAVPYLRRASSAYALMSSQYVEAGYQSGNPMRWGTLSGANDFTDGDLATWRDEDGVIYMAGRDVLDNSAAFVQMSRDNGATWEKIGESSNALGWGGSWWYGNDALVYPSRFTGCMTRGQAVILHGCESNYATTFDDSLHASYLGGWTDLCLPSLTFYHDPRERASWERTWLPIDTPDTLGGHWTPATVGAPVIAFGADGMTITGGVGDSKSYTSAAVVTTLSEGLMADMQVTVTAGTAFLSINIADAVPVSYATSIKVTPTAISLVDDNAVSTIATVATTAGASGVVVRLAQGNDDNVRAYYRTASTGGESDRRWVLIGASTTLTAAATAGDTVSWGIVAPVAGTTDADFALVQYTFAANMGYLSGTNYALFTAQINPTDLLGKAFSSTPVWVDDGVRVALPAGPAAAGDVWNIDTAYDYGVASIFPDRSPSPRRTWRSTVETQQDIVVEYDSTLDQEIPMIEPVLGLALININFRLFELWGYDKDGGAYVKLLDGDAATGQAGLSFARSGDSILPASGVVAADYYTFNILEDSHVKLTGTGDGATTVIRRIRTNSEGAWRSSGTKATTIVLEDVVSTDALGGGAMTADIWSRDVVAIIPATTKYTRYRLRILAQDTAEGYFEIGSMVLGPVVYLGHQYGRGRVLGHEHAYDLTTSRYGIRTARRLAPMRRSVEFNWVEGVDVSQICATQPTPDYVYPYTGASVAAATPRDTPYAVAGLSEYLRGAVTPLVYLPRVEKGASSAAAHIVNRNRLLYGRLVTNPRLESIVGDEWESELLSVATVTIEEET